MLLVGGRLVAQGGHVILMLVTEVIVNRLLRQVANRVIDGRQLSGLLQLEGQLRLEWRQREAGRARKQMTHV